MRKLGRGCALTVGYALAMFVGLCLYMAVHGMNPIEFWWSIARGWFGG